MLRWGLAILGVGLVLLVILERSGGLGSCGPRPGMLPVLIGFMLALSVGGLLTLIGLVQLAIDRFRHRKEGRAIPRITPL
jgi:hypothetical protein